MFLVQRTEQLAGAVEAVGPFQRHGQREPARSRTGMLERGRRADLVVESDGTCEELAVETLARQERGHAQVIEGFGDQDTVAGVFGGVERR